MKKRVRASAVCVSKQGILMVRLREPRTGVVRLFPPGGAIEPGESPAQAAARETFEETGLAVAVDERVRLVRSYPFAWDGVVYAVETHFFLAFPAGVSLELPRVRDADYNQGACWLPEAEVAGALAYDEVIRDAVLEILRHASG